MNLSLVIMAVKSKGMCIRHLHDDHVVYCGAFLNNKNNYKKTMVVATYGDV